MSWQILNKHKQIQSYLLYHWYNTQQRCQRVLLAGRENTLTDYTYIHNCWLYIHTTVDYTYTQLLTICIHNCWLYIYTTVDNTYTQLLTIHIHNCWLYIYTTVDYTYTQLFTIHIHNCWLYIYTTVDYTYTQLS